MTDNPDETTLDNDGTPSGASESSDDKTPEGKAPKWEGDFDPDRAARLVANLRKEADEAKKAAAGFKSQLDEIEDSKKTEAQRLAEKLQEAQTEAATARQALLVATVAKKFGVPDDFLDFLTATDEAGLTAQAERLATLGTPKPNDVSGKPKPRLNPGGKNSPDTEDTFDPDEVAKRVRARNGLGL